MFKILWGAISRSIVRDKFYAVINILGLSSGITASLFIFLYAIDELSFDKFHSRADDIYRIALTLKFGELDLYLPMASPPLASALQQGIPEIESVTRLYGINLSMAFKNNTKSFIEKKVLYADSNFFEFFDFELLRGNKKKVLREPNTVVLTVNTSLRYFDSLEAIGEMILIDGETYSISGIAANPPSNSHIQFDILISMASNSLAKSNVWMGNRFFTYVKLNRQASLSSAEKKMDELVANRIGPDLENSVGISLAQFQSQGNKIGYDLHALTATRLKSKFPSDITPASDAVYVHIFIIIAVALLVIACINFINLSTARTANKLKEVSIRRALGSPLFMVFGQFVVESFIITTASAFISLILLFLFLPDFNLLSGKSLQFHSIFSPLFIAGFVGTIILTSLVSGSYPAFHFMIAKVSDALQGRSRGVVQSRKLRMALVVFQNTISVGLIIFTIILFEQLNLISQMPIGFDKSEVIAIKNTSLLKSNAAPLKNALQSESGILAASYSDRLIFEKMSVDAVRIPHEEKSHILNFYGADEDHLNVMGYELIQGRFFSHDLKSDSNAVVVNEAVMHEFGWENIEGQEMASDGDYRYKIVGVIKDFNYESLRNKIRPLMIVNDPRGNTLNVRFNEITPTEAISILKKNWDKYGQGYPFEYSFLDSDYNALFLSEKKTSRMFIAFSGLIWFIACLGLFALASFASEQRAREIGIRKVMGASVKNIATLLSLQFVKLVGLSILISFGPVYLCASSWLQGFAYRINLTFLPFLLASFSVILITLITVSFHSIKAATVNPAQTLRTK